MDKENSFRSTDHVESVERNDSEVEQQVYDDGTNTFFW